MLIDTVAVAAAAAAAAAGPTQRYQDSVPAQLSS